MRATTPPVPDLTYDGHGLIFSGSKDDDDDPQEIKLDLAEIGKRHPLVYVASTLECTGNRAKDMMTQQPLRIHRSET
jgi:hypothetical protein